jgi:hypothetical protein
MPLRIAFPLALAGCLVLAGPSAAGDASATTAAVTPSPGKFKGRTSRQEAMSITVSRRHRIVALNFKHVRYSCPDGYQAFFNFSGGGLGVAIVGGKFKHRWDGTDSGRYSFRFALAGAFPSAKRAIGASGLKIIRPDHGGTCTNGTPTWTARHT